MLKKQETIATSLRTRVPATERDRHLAQTPTGFPYTLERRLLLCYGLRALSVQRWTARERAALAAKNEDGPP